MSETRPAPISSKGQRYLLGLVILIIIVALSYLLINLYRSNVDLTRSNETLKADYHRIAKLYADARVPELQTVFADYRQLFLEMMHQQKLMRSLIPKQGFPPIQKATLIVDFYNPPIRRNETLVVLQANILNPFIEKVIILAEGKEDFGPVYNLIQAEKIQIVPFGKRFTPGEAFEYLNKQQELKGKIIISANSDIMFDLSLVNLRHFNVNKKSFWAISRRRSLFDVRPRYIHSHPDMCFRYLGSHDAFIFMPPVDPLTIRNTIDIYLGQWGYENRIIHGFQAAGYETHNPCFHINAIHYTTKEYPKQDETRVNEGGRSGIIQPNQPDPEWKMDVNWPGDLPIVRS